MKKAKKLASLLLALVMIFAMATTAFAAGTTSIGSITINSSDTVSVEGKTFNAYKILDLELVGDDGYVYTVPDELKSFYANYFSIDQNAGDFSAQVRDKLAEMTNNSDDLFAFATAALAAAKTAGITPGTATGATGAASVTIGNLPLGYYVVEDVGTATPISALMLQSTAPDVEVTIKASKPSIDKKIVEEDEATTTSNNAAIGDIVNFKVASKVPDMTGYTKYFYVVNDTMSKGLTFNNDEAITVGGTLLTKDNDYTVVSTQNDDGTTSIEIVFKNFIQYKDQKNADIIITYSATINENAVIGKDPNTNEVTLTYSNNPNGSQDGEPDNPDKPKPGDATGETPTSTTYTYVTGMELIKVDPNGNRLIGAEFQITGEKLNKVLVETDVFTEDANGEYWKLKDGSYTTQAPVTDENADGYNADKYESTSTKYAKSTTTTIKTITEAVNATGTVGEDGVLRFDGLAAGAYTITEMKAPDGYNLLAEPISVTITWTAPETGETECTWTATGANIVAPGIAQLEIENNTGTVLPSTGGIGTTIFYVIGGILVIGAAILLVTKKRLSAEKD